MGSIVVLDAKIIKDVLRGGFKYFLYSPRTLGKWSNLTHIFQMGWNHQPENFTKTLIFSEENGKIMISGDEGMFFF